MLLSIHETPLGVDSRHIQCCIEHVTCWNPLKLEDKHSLCKMRASELHTTEVLRKFTAVDSVLALTEEASHHYTVNWLSSSIFSRVWWWLKSGHWAWVVVFVWLGLVLFVICCCCLVGFLFVWLFDLFVFSYYYLFQARQADLQTQFI